MLLSAISAKLAEDMKETQLLLPYAAGSLLDDVHTMGRVVSVAYEEDGARVTLTASGLVRLEAGDIPTAAVACDPSSTITVEAGATVMTVQLVR